MRDSKTNMPKRLLTSRKRQYRIVMASIDRFGYLLMDPLSDPNGGLPESLTERPIDVFLPSLRQDLFTSRRDFVLKQRELQKLENRMKEASALVAGAASDASGLLVALKTTLGPLFTDEAMGLLGFARQTTSTPEELLEQLVAVADGLGDPANKRPMQRLKSMVVDTSATVDEEIVPATNALREAMQNVADLNRDVFLARDRRDAALKAYDRAYLWVSRTVESLFMLAGHENIAANVRLSARSTSSASTEPADTDPQAPPSPSPQPSAAVPAPPANDA